MELTYTKCGDYYYPDLELKENNRTYRKYGMLRKKFLKEHRNGTYSAMLLRQEPQDHLADIDEEARSQVECIMSEMAKSQGVTEELKKQDQMLWVGMMNNIKQATEEIVLRDLVYA